MVERSARNKLTRCAALSEKQELLLSRFHDGECSCLRAFLARRLIARRAAARDFISNLETLKDQCAQLSASTNDQALDLWSRIDSRIEQEQRAAFYLGERRIAEAKPQRISYRYAAVGGLSGAAVAAALLLVISRPTQLLTFSAPVAGPVDHNSLVQPVGLSSISAMSPENSVGEINSIALSVRIIQANEPYRFEDAEFDSATNSVNRTIHIGNNIRDLGSKLSQLPFNSFHLLTDTQGQVAIERLEALRLSNGHTLTVRPVYSDPRDARMWLNWRDRDGAEILTTHVHLDSSDAILTCSNCGENSGIVLAIRASIGVR
jgi:hypothetical protein